MLIESTQIEYCALFVQHWSTCMQKSEWASWMQAIGAVGAIYFAGRFARNQVHLQSLNDRAQQVATESDKEIAAITATLLVLDSYRSAVSAFAEQFDSSPRNCFVAPPPVWSLPGNHAEMPCHTNVITLAFLVRHNAQDVFNDLQKIELAVRNCESAMKARAELMIGPYVRVRLIDEHEKKRTRPSPADWPAVLGDVAFGMVLNATQIVSDTSVYARDLLVTKIPEIRAKVSRLYPSAKFPFV